MANEEHVSNYGATFSGILFVFSLAATGFSSVSLLGEISEPKIPQPDTEQYFMYTNKAAAALLKGHNLSKENITIDSKHIYEKMVSLYQEDLTNKIENGKEFLGYLALITILSGISTWAYWKERPVVTSPGSTNTFHNHDL